ncbi:hypothetical protein D3C75_1310580 [compost metagenome]
MKSNDTVIQKLNRLRSLQLNYIVHELHEILRFSLCLFQLFEQPFVGGEERFVIG